MHRKECKNDELEDVAEMRWEDGEETPHLSVYFYIVVCDRQFDMLPTANQKACVKTEGKVCGTGCKRDCRQERISTLSG